MTRTIALALLALAACGRDPDVLRPAEALPPSLVALAPLDLAGHAAYDRLDASFASAPARLKAYDDLARLAPDDRLVLVRGGLAALAEGSDKGRAVLAGVLAKVTARWPDDPDVLYLSLLARRERLASEDGTLRATEANLADLKALAADAAAFAERFPAWTGPSGATVADVHRIRSAAAAAFDALPSPGPADARP